jgi:hypothetical protein
MKHFDALSEAIYEEELREDSREYVGNVMEVIKREKETAFMAQLDEMERRAAHVNFENDKKANNEQCTK